jgi:hypothetical protein
LRLVVSYNIHPTWRSLQMLGVEQYLSTEPRKISGYRYLCVVFYFATTTLG